VTRNPCGAGASACQPSPACRRTPPNPHLSSLAAALTFLLLSAPLPAQTLKVRIANATVNLPLEQYVAGVLAGETSTFHSGEALQAMAIAARTYAAHFRGRHAAEGYDLCATTHCQHLDLGSITARLQTAADQTAGIMLWFEGKPALACYSRDCGGVTESGDLVWNDLRAPYLRSHADPYCPRARWQWSRTAAEISQALTAAQLRTPARLLSIEITQRTASGRAKELTLLGDLIGDRAGEQQRVRIAASSFRFAIGRAFGFNTIRSDLWEATLNGARWTFTGTGDGHGAGLCQLGADQMGAQGKTYREILAFYYPGTVLGVTAQGLEWHRMAGETATLMTTRPDRDRTVLALAEEQVRKIAAHTGWPAPPLIEIRIYPDTATFRNATGEPGWVAARASGRRISMQPGATLPVIRHELLHVFVTAQSTATLPVWFREGLVEYLDAPATAGSATTLDTDLRQREDPERARQAYAAAARRVSTLVHRYGEAAVLGWLKSGLPSEVTTPAR
jgi:stage II sporulation protein D